MTEVTPGAFQLIFFTTIQTDSDTGKNDQVGYETATSTFATKVLVKLMSVTV